MKNNHSFVSNKNKTTILKKDIQQIPDFRLNEEIQKNKNYHSLVIPAYNEEKRIGPFLDSLVDVLDESYEIIVVSDGDDDTPSIVKKYCNNVRLLEFQNRLGKGGAILEGFKVAQGKVIGFVDADGAINVNDIIKISNSVTKGMPCVVGSRWVKSSVIASQESFFNVFAGRIFHYLVYLLLGIGTKDTQCGVKFFDSRLLSDIIHKITITGRMMDVALLFHVKKLGFPIQEVGIKWNHIPDSKLPILRAVPIMFAILIGLRIRHSEFGEKTKVWKNFREYVEESI